MWSVFLSPDAQDFLDKQDTHIASRLRSGLEKLRCENPFHYLEHFEEKDYYKFRIGNYRALVDLDFEHKIIKVQVLDLRGRIYERKH